MKSGKGFVRLIGKYSYIIVFALIFVVYVITSSGLTWGGMMNIFRHSAVVGIIASRVRLTCPWDPCWRWTQAFPSSYLI